MSDGVAEEKNQHHYQSTHGLDYESVPWRLWEKSKKLFWDPADLDFSQDIVDWREMSDEARTLIALSARGFMVGEEAVTLDIIPLMRAMSDQGRLEDTMYLSMFAMEEAKHTDMFRRWFDAVELDPTTLDDLVRQQREDTGRRFNVFDGELTKVMRRLDTDQSPQAILDATLIYNQLVEGVAAIAGYRRWDATFKVVNKLPGLQAGLKLTQRDERRHIAYGTYLGRRVLAENPDLWGWLEKRWAELTDHLTLSYGGGDDADKREQALKAQGLPTFDPEFQQGLAKRRLEALSVGRSMKRAEVDSSAIEAFEPEELQHIV